VGRRNRNWRAEDCAGSTPYSVRIVCSARLRTSGAFASRSKYSAAVIRSKRTP
jgi:hypothetical protein